MASCLTQKLRPELYVKMDDIAKKNNITQKTQHFMATLKLSHKHLVLESFYPIPILVNLWWIQGACCVETVADQLMWKNTAFPNSISLL